MEFILIFFLSIFIFLLFVSIKFYSNKCPPPRYIYRYVPQTFQELQNNFPNASTIFSNMFNEPPVMKSPIE